MNRFEIVFVIAVAYFLTEPVIGQFDTVNSGDYTFSVSQNQVRFSLHELGD